MEYMIIEHFKKGMLRKIYERADLQGRMLPADLSYINSWVDESLTTCYQLMSTGNPASLQEWISHWNDLVDFEIIPLISSSEARKSALS